MTAGKVFLAIAVLVILYLAYKFIFAKPANGTPCKTNGGADSNDGIIVDGVCVKTDVPQNDSQNADPLSYDYFVNGDEDHDKKVFALGLECAKSLLYRDLRNDMAKSVLANMGRPGSAGPCAGFNCKLAGVIDGMNQQDKLSILNYVNSIDSSSGRENADAWKYFANLAVGNKNMCSVILEQAVKTKLPGIWATVGRG